MKLVEICNAYINLSAVVGFSYRIIDSPDPSWKFCVQYLVYLKSGQSVIVEEIWTNHYSADMAYARIMLC